MRHIPPLLALSVLVLAPAACGSEPAPAPEAVQTASETPETPAPTISPQGEAGVDAIPADLRALGTEPFWAAQVGASEVRYMTPEDIEGRTFPVTRNDEDGAAVITGMLDDTPFELRVVRELCSDGMSDREYPFRVERTVGGEIQHGCARPPE